MSDARAQISLTTSERKEFLEQSRILHIASNGPHGTPHLVPMWYVVIDGDIHFSTYAKSQKIRNLKRDSRVTCMIESGDSYDSLRGLVIEGEAKILDDSLEMTVTVMQLVGKKYSNSRRTRQSANSLTRAAEKRVIVRIIPKHHFSWDHTKLHGQ